MCLTEGGRSAGNRNRCDCDQANPNTLVSTEEHAAVCNLCGVVVEGLVLFHPVNRHEVVSEDPQGSYSERLGCSGPVHSKVQIKLKELENDPTATLDAPRAYDKRLICVRDAWIEFIENDNTGISFDAVEDFPKLEKRKSLT
ncbi:hypothetical protein CYMTET_25954 [Cymbomonas tetramitiformis]|uniref:Uncharacterized protein n=1 Tax=Cymbomonas tetramitiformis TaxID=36881 RepID=A0AAE0KYQ3_9CHLO|nr:hypothetical protein CYMTET_25954 [Cymbomonas tetramitiformis]